MNLRYQFEEETGLSVYNGWNPNDNFKESYVKWLEEKINIIDKDQIKDYCVRFFQWWYNMPGNNTEDGFDLFWDEHVKHVIANQQSIKNIKCLEKRFRVSDIKMSIESFKFICIHPVSKSYVIVLDEYGKPQRMTLAEWDKLIIKDYNTAKNKLIDLLQSTIDFYKR